MDKDLLDFYVRFYAKHNPSITKPQIEGMLRENAGYEKELLRDVVNRYDPEALNSPSFKQAQPMLEALKNPFATQMQRPPEVFNNVQPPVRDYTQQDRNAYQEPLSLQQGYVGKMGEQMAYDNAQRQQRESITNAQVEQSGRGNANLPQPFTFQKPLIANNEATPPMWQNNPEYDKAVSGQGLINVGDLGAFEADPNGIMLRERATGKFLSLSQGGISRMQNEYAKKYTGLSLQQLSPQEQGKVLDSFNEQYPTPQDFEQTQALYNRASGVNPNAGDVEDTFSQVLQGAGIGIGRMENAGLGALETVANLGRMAMPTHGMESLNFKPNQPWIRENKGNVVVDAFSGWEDVEKRQAANVNRRVTQDYGIEQKYLMDDQAARSGFSSGRPTNTTKSLGDEVLKTTAESLPIMAATIASGGTAAPFVAGGLTGLQNAQQEIGAAKKAGASDTDALIAGTFGMAAGAAEGLIEARVIGRMLKGFNPKTSVGTALFDSFIKSPMEEGAAEAGSQFIQNIGAKLTYDKARDLSEGVAKSAELGALSGMLIGSPSVGYRTVRSTLNGIGKVYLGTLEAVKLAQSFSPRASDVRNYNAALGEMRDAVETLDDSVRESIQQARAQLRDPQFAASPEGQATRENLSHLVVIGEQMQSVLGNMPSQDSDIRGIDTDRLTQGFIGLNATINNALGIKPEETQQQPVPQPQVQPEGVMPTQEQPVAQVTPTIQPQQESVVQPEITPQNEVVQQDIQPEVQQVVETPTQARVLPKIGKLQYTVTDAIPTESGMQYQMVNNVGNASTVEVNVDENGDYVVTLQKGDKSIVQGNKTVIGKSAIIAYEQDKAAQVEQPITQPEDAIQEQSTAEIPLGNRPESSQGVPEGNPQGQETTEQSQAQEVGGVQPDYQSMSFDDLVALQKSKYPDKDVDIEAPMSQDEKDLRRAIADKASIMNQGVRDRRAQMDAEAVPSGFIGKIAIVTNANGRRVKYRVEEHNTRTGSMYLVNESTGKGIRKKYGDNVEIEEDVPTQTQQPLNEQTQGEASTTSNPNIGNDAGIAGTSETPERVAAKNKPKAKKVTASPESNKVIEDTAQFAETNTDASVAVSEELTKESVSEAEIEQPIEQAQTPAKGKSLSKEEFTTKYGISFEELVAKIALYTSEKRYDSIERVMSDFSLDEAPINELLRDILQVAGDNKVKIKPKIDQYNIVGATPFISKSSPLVNKLKSGIGSLVNIVAKKDLFPSANKEGVFVEKDSLVATDAEKLAIIKRQPNDGLNKMVGKIISPKTSLPIETDAKFPNYKDVIPSPVFATKEMPIEDVIATFNGIQDIYRNIEHGKGKPFAISIIEFQDGTEDGLTVGMNQSSMIDALQVLQANGAKTIQIWPLAYNRAITITADNGNKAIIMPLMASGEYLNVIEPIVFPVFFSQEALGSMELSERRVLEAKKDLDQAKNETAREVEQRFYDKEVAKLDKAKQMKEDILSGAVKPTLENIRDIGTNQLSEALQPAVSDASILRGEMKTQQMARNKVSASMHQFWFTSFVDFIQSALGTANTKVSFDPQAFQDALDTRNTINGTNIPASDIRGFYDQKTGTIHINTDTATEDTLFHEYFEVWMAALKGTDAAIFDGILNRFKAHISQQADLKQQLADAQTRRAAYYDANGIAYTKTSLFNETLQELYMSYMGQKLAESWKNEYSKKTTEARVKARQAFNKSAIGKLINDAMGKLSAWLKRWFNVDLETLVKGETRAGMALRGALVGGAIGSVASPVIGVGGAVAGGIAGAFRSAAALKKTSIDLRNVSFLDIADRLAEEIMAIPTLIGYQQAGNIGLERVYRMTDTQFAKISFNKRSVESQTELARQTAAREADPLSAIGEPLRVVPKTSEVEQAETEYEADQRKQRAHILKAEKAQRAQRDKNGRMVVIPNIGRYFTAFRHLMYSETGAVKDIIRAIAKAGGINFTVDGAISSEVQFALGQQTGALMANFKEWMVGAQKSFSGRTIKSREQSFTNRVTKFLNDNSAALGIGKVNPAEAMQMWGSILAALQSTIGGRNEGAYQVAVSEGIEAEYQRQNERVDKAIADKQAEIDSLDEINKELENYTEQKLADMIARMKRDIIDALTKQTANGFRLSQKRSDFENQKRKEVAAEFARFRAERKALLKRKADAEKAMPRWKEELKSLKETRLLLLQDMDKMRYAQDGVSTVHLLDKNDLAQQRMDKNGQPNPNFSPTESRIVVDFEGNPVQFLAPIDGHPLLDARSGYLQAYPILRTLQNADLLPQVEALHAEMIAQTAAMYAPLVRFESKTQEQVDEELNRYGFYVPLVQRGVTTQGTETDKESEADFTGGKPTLTGKGHMIPFNKRQSPMESYATFTTQIGADAHRIATIITLGRAAQESVGGTISQKAPTGNFTTKVLKTLSGISNNDNNRDISNPLFKVILETEIDDLSREERDFMPPIRYTDNGVARAIIIFKDKASADNKGDTVPQALYEGLTGTGQKMDIVEKAAQSNYWLLSGVGKAIRAWNQTKRTAVLLAPSFAAAQALFVDRLFTGFSLPIIANKIPSSYFRGKIGKGANGKVKIDNYTKEWAISLAFVIDLAAKGVPTYSPDVTKMDTWTQRDWYAAFLKYGGNMDLMSHFGTTPKLDSGDIDFNKVLDTGGSPIVGLETFTNAMTAVARFTSFRMVAAYRDVSGNPAYSLTEAGQIALEAPINFADKGTAASLLGGLYFLYSGITAGVAQGTTLMARSLKKSFAPDGKIIPLSQIPKAAYHDRFLASSAVVFGRGVMQGFVIALLGIGGDEEDEKKAKVKKTHKELLRYAALNFDDNTRNISMPLGGQMRTAPMVNMPYHLGSFLGRQMAAAIAPEDVPSPTLQEITGQFMADAVSNLSTPLTDPLVKGAKAMRSGGDAGKAVFISLVPTDAAKITAEIGLNYSVFFQTPIYYSKGRDGKPEYLIGDGKAQNTLAAPLAEATSIAKRGLSQIGFPFPELNVAQADYLMNSTTATMGKDITGAYAFVASLIDDQEGVADEQLPLLRGMQGKPQQRAERLAQQMGANSLNEAENGMPITAPKDVLELAAKLENVKKQEMKVNRQQKKASGVRPKALTLDELARKAFRPK